MVWRETGEGRKGTCGRSGCQEITVVGNVCHKREVILRGKGDEVDFWGMVIDLRLFTSRRVFGRDYRIGSEMDCVRGSRVRIVQYYDLPSSPHKRTNSSFRRFWLRRFSIKDFVS